MSACWRHAGRQEGLMSMGMGLLPVLGIGDAFPTSPCVQVSSTNRSDRFQPDRFNTCLYRRRIKQKSGRGAVRQMRSTIDMGEQQLAKQVSAVTDHQVKRCSVAHGRRSTYAKKVTEDCHKRGDFQTMIFIITRPV